MFFNILYQTDYGMIEVYDFESGKVEEFLKRRKVKRAAVQLPADFKSRLREITPVFERTGVEALILADSCYGACDLADKKAKQLGCDALIHYGHADMGLPVCLPTLFVEARMTVDPTEAIERVLPELKGRLGLATTVQHIGHLERTKEMLERNAVEVVTGEPGPRVKYPGLVLGCDWGCVKSVAGDVDGFLYLGTGRFHPLGIALATGKSVVVVNPIAGGWEKLSPKLDDFIRRRKAMIARASVCEKFGVVTSIKPGQRRFKLMENLVHGLRSSGMSAESIVADEIVPEKLSEFQVEAFVCAACPWIPIDDAERFDRPVLSPFEAMVLLGKMDLEPYQLDEIGRSDVEVSARVKSS
ncbi:MAG: diphthamide biosynthesis enzyme Dph2 [Candidatus Hadarchaeota archaeon]|nr:diphthamide biosynthesis enzyme Dph2 [Candidatus Hadarchaeota archaeon]